MPKAVIFDYGVGNLLSLKCALEKAGLEVSIGTSAQELAEADAIALPGVGNFSAAATKLDAVKETLQNKVQEGTPLLGICLGLQLVLSGKRGRTRKRLSILRRQMLTLTRSLKSAAHGLEHTKYR